METIITFAPVAVLLCIAVACGVAAGRMAARKGYDRRMFTLLGLLMSVPVFLLLYLMPDNRLPDRR